MTNSTACQTSSLLLHWIGFCHQLTYPNPEPPIEDLTVLIGHYAGILRKSFIDDLASGYHTIQNVIAIDAIVM